MLQLLLVAGAVWAVIYARCMLNPLQEAVRLGLSLSDSEVAWLQGPALAAPMALGAIPLGLLVDRASRARLLVLVLALSVAASLLTAIASSLAALVAARCLVGLAVATALIGGYSLVADLYGPVQRGRATMVVALGEVGGAPAAFALGGMFLGMIGSAPGASQAAWRSALLWMTVPLVPVALAMLALREPTRTGIVSSRASLRDTWRELWHYRAVVAPLLVARIMVWIADGAVFVWAAPMFARRFALSPERIGAIMGSALLLSGILGPILGGPLADLCHRSGGPGRTLTALAALAMLSIPVALFALTPSAALAGIFMAAFLTLGYAFGTVALTLATIVIPGELRGVYLALSVTVAALFSSGAAPLVVSTLSAALGGPAMIGKALALVCVAGSILGAAVFALVRRRFVTAAARFNTEAGAGR